MDAGTGHGDHERTGNGRAGGAEVTGGAGVAGNRSGEFLLLATRADDAVADAEYEAVRRFMGVPAERLRRVRLESAPMPRLDLGSIAGIVVGGSPFTSSDPIESKSDVQLRVENEMAELLAEVVAIDLPFFGACYGVGTLGGFLGGIVDTTYGEPVGAVPVALTPEGLADPVLAGLPPVFDAYVGHKEALRAIPPGAVLLGTTATAPVQMMRVGRNVYATQFHPELDTEGIVQRLLAYRHEGYYDPAEVDDVVARVRGADVREAWKVLRNFALVYG